MSADAGMKTNVRQAVPFFRVVDMPRSVRFYVDGLGYKMTKHWTVDGALRWCWLEIGETALMLQGYVEDSPEGWKPSGKPGEGVSISYQCEDALALYHEFKGRGIACTRPFVGNAMWFFAVTDPDGYVLEFESDTDVAEGTEYKEE